MADVTTLAFIDSTGYHYTDFPTFLAWYQTQYKNIYGQDVYLGPDSQDGQFVSVVAQSAFDTAALGSATYNSFSPVTAQGVGLSRVVKINGIKRQGATHSTVQLAIGGVNGTVLNNAIAVDILQQQWSIPNGTTIPIGGTVTVTATAIAPGAISAAANTITGIFTPTLGWQTVNNSAPATLGVATQTDSALRTKQIQSVAIPSLTVLDGTRGAVLNVNGVVTAVVYENDTGSVDANGIPAHSIAAVVEGGVDTDIAQAIQVHKTPGTRTFGTTTVTVQDTRGMPLDIHFYYATPASIQVQVTITQLGSYVSSTANLIKAAVAAYITNPANVSIGGKVVITQLVVAAYLLGTPQAGSFNIVSILIGKNGGGLGTSDISLLFNEVATCNPSVDVTVLP